MTNTPSRPSRRDTLKTLLYSASGAASLPLMSTLAACSPDIKQELSPYMELITHISELIIPRTDTPGAIDAGVPAYIEALVGTHYVPDERERFKTGLSIFDERAHSQSTASFLTANTEQQANILTTLDLEAHPIWMELKRVVVFGYYTSEAATEELQYDPIPGRYVGDIKLADVGRAWLTTGI